MVSLTTVLLVASPFIVLIGIFAYVRFFSPPEGFDFGNITNTTNPKGYTLPNITNQKLNTTIPTIEEILRRANAGFLYGS